MAGVGEALTILGLLVSVAENHRAIAAPIRRYRHFHKDIKKFQRRLANIETIYRANAELLLRSVVGVEQARDMAEDPEHFAWRSEDLEMSIAQCLRNRYSTCMSTIEAIEESLEGLDPIKSKFEAILEQHAQNSPFDIKSRGKEIAKRLWSCLSEFKGQQKLQELKKHAEEFERLVLLNDRLMVGSEQVLYTPYLRVLSPEIISKLNLIHNTSSNLYETLEHSCKAHNHNAHFNLQPTLSTPCTKRIQYELAYRQAPAYVEEQRFLSSDFVWLAVESSGDGKEGDKNAVQQSKNDSRQGEASTLASRNAKRKLEPSIGVLLSTRVPKQVAFATTQSPASFVLPSLLPDLSNLCETQSLCIQIKRQYHQVAENESCIGYLEKQPGSKYLVYLRKPLTSDNYASTPINSVLKSLDHSEHDTVLLRAEKIRFAKLMATAVLHLGTTAWFMNGIWRSSDIHVFMKNGNPSLDNPYVNVEIALSDRQTKKPPPKTPRFIRNQPLFSLALILLEIAYEAPLAILRTDSDSVDGISCVDFNTAERLSNTVSSKLGPRYKRIVRRCLFPMSDIADLTECELQTMMYFDVVRELEQLESICRNSM